MVNVPRQGEIWWAETVEKPRPVVLAATILFGLLATV